MANRDIRQIVLELLPPAVVIQTRAHLLQDKIQLNTRSFSVVVASNILVAQAGGYKGRTRHWASRVRCSRSPCMDSVPA